MTKNSFLYTAICIAIYQPIFAQEVTPDNSTDTIISLADITVTGERVDRNLFNTASSIAVISDDDVTNNPHQQTVKETVAEVPNIYLPSTAGAPTIRGQAAQGPNERATAFLSGTVPRATITIDGQALNFNELNYGVSSLWDIDQVEVFRGPQTTTQGANSIAGAIIVNTKDPSFTPEFSGQLLYGSRNKHRASFAASGPILTNDFAGRIALDYYGREQFVNFNNPNFNPEGLNTDFQSGTIRAKLLYLPESIPDLEAKLTLSHRQSEGPQNEAVSEPFADLNDNSESPVNWKITTDGAILDLSYQLSPNFSVSNQLLANRSDIDRQTAPSYNGGADISQDDIANELRFNYDDKERISAVGGIYMRRSNSDDFLKTLGYTPGSIMTHKFDDRKDSFGVYGELTYQINDQLALTGGLRWQQDKMQRSGTSDFAPNKLLDYDGRSSALLPKFVVNYRVNDNVNIGAMVNKGYNPAGVSFSFKQGEFIPFEAESVWNYELFSRASLLDNRLNINANIFYSDFKDSQRYVRTALQDINQTGLDTDIVTVNAETAKAWGAEFAANYEINPKWQLQSSFGVLETEITEFTNSIADYEGKSFERSPSYTLSLGSQWQANDDLRLSINYKRVGSYFTDDSNTPDYKIKPYNVVNTQASWQPYKDIEIFAYANNLFDDRSPTAIFAPGRGQTSATANVVEPREFGIGLRAEW